MKHIYISFCTLALLMTLTISVKAQTTYSINSNANWSAKLPSTCNSCTINIASGATLTVDQNATCQNCTFAGGKISIASKTLNIQYSGGSAVTTNFNGTVLTATGTAQIVVNAPISLSSSTFTFSGTASMTTSYNVTLTSSTIYLNGNAAMTSNGNPFTLISLISGSRIVIGDGSKTSAAIFTVSGPTMIVYDVSSVAVANQDNVFYDWSPYLYQASVSGSILTAKAYNTSTLNMNCGAGYSNSCSSPSLYGPATVASGVTPGVTLPIILDGFTAVLNNNQSVTLNWNTQMQLNFSHFVIERSADGENWNEIGTIDGAGNSNVQIDYSFTDDQPLNGTNYYRLVLVNLDNSYTYSDVKVLQTGAVAAKVNFFPNPAHDYVNISLEGTTGKEVTILLTSVSGRLLQEKTAAAGSVVTFSIQNVASGMYFLTVVNADGTRQSSPVLISRS